MYFIIFVSYCNNNFDDFYSWLKAVVYIILDKRESWYHLSPKHVGDSGFLVESFFSSINVLLEKQFRFIVTKSIIHYAEIFSIYKVMSIFFLINLA